MDPKLHKTYYNAADNRSPFDIYRRRLIRHKISHASFKDITTDRIPGTTLESSVKYQYYENSNRGKGLSFCTGDHCYGEPELKDLNDKKMTQYLLTTSQGRNILEKSKTQEFFSIMNVI